MININEILSDLKKHKFYDLNKSYTYLYKKYKIKPNHIVSYKIKNGIKYEGDIYKIGDEELEIFGTTNKDLNILCEYIIHKK